MSETFNIKNLKGLTQDSRSVKQGYLFAALPGSKSDGRKFIASALENGAVAVLAPAGTSLPANTKGITLITDENPRRKLALLAAEFYKLQPKCTVAVTGTNGKTSTAHFVKQIWKTRGFKAASIGTLGVRAPGMIRSGSMTTPDPVSLHAELADMAAAGIDHLAMEASSHGLDQNRLDGVRLLGAGFTNLSRDHLDYHPDMETYFHAKARLFSDILVPGGLAVLNSDVAEFERLQGITIRNKQRVLSYGFKAQDLKILSAQPTGHGQDLQFSVFGKTHQISLNLVGTFQVMNALCALGLSLAGENLEDHDLIAQSVQALAKIHGAPGRLQLVPGHPKGAAVYIDYAHTPDALENVLAALRPHTEGKLVCVFGCGGDRDAGKRPIMGKIAARMADITIVTDDNPRSEIPAEIRKEIMGGAKGAREIANRQDAIREAIAGLQKGDVLVIAGKGHEQGQIFADRTDPFDDFTEAQNAIGALNA